MARTLQEVYCVQLFSRDGKHCRREQQLISDYLMNNIDSLLQEIEGADLFSAIEKADIDLPSVILIPGVGSVFVDPVISAFEGLYDKTEWLPTSTSQEDPFYSKLDVGSELADMRKVITKAVMAATRNCDMSKLACTPP